MSDDQLIQRLIGCFHKPSLFKEESLGEKFFDAFEALFTRHEARLQAVVREAVVRHNRRTAREDFAELIESVAAELLDRIEEYPKQASTFRYWSAKVAEETVIQWISQHPHSTEPERYTPEDLKAPLPKCRIAARLEKTPQCGSFCKILSAINQQKSPTIIASEHNIPRGSIDALISRCVALIGTRNLPGE